MPRPTPDGARLRARRPRDLADRLGVGRRRRPASGSSPGRRRVRRRRIAAWLAVTAVAIGVQRTVADATAERDAWGGTVPVLVVRRSLGPGVPVTPRDVEHRRMPPALVPDGHLTELPDDGVAAVGLPAGTVLSSPLVPARRGSDAARSLPAGRVAVAVSTGELPRLAEAGDVVDVAAPTWDAPVASAATVLRVDGEAVTLAVRPDDAAATAAASLAGPVALVVRP